jgi:hypothetical protein
MIERLQRNAVVACVLMTALAAVLARNLAAPAGVLGGGLIAGISFLAIRGGVEDLSMRRSVGLALLKMVGRYALLGFLAYVMIARLRLPPLALMAGASSVVAAAVVEAVRLLLTKNTKTLNR